MKITNFNFFLQLPVWPNNYIHAYLSESQMLGPMSQYVISKSLFLTLISEIFWIFSSSPSVYRMRLFRINLVNELLNRAHLMTKGCLSCGSSSAFIEILVAIIYEIIGNGIHFERQVRQFKDIRDTCFYKYFPNFSGVSFKFLVVGRLKLTCRMKLFSYLSLF